MNFPINPIIAAELDKIKKTVKSLSISYISTQEEFDKLKQENFTIENNQLKNISSKKIIFLCDNFNYNETRLIDLLQEIVNDNPELLCDYQLIYIDNPYLRFELFYNKKYSYSLKKEEISNFEKTHSLSFVLVSGIDNYFYLLSEKFIFFGIQKNMISHLLQENKKPNQINQEECECKDKQQSSNE